MAGTHSGAGKTTVATGLMAAFRAVGRRVGAAKVGPDFIDPGYHALATGRPGRNLDAWLCGSQRIRGLAARAAHDRDLLIIEGVMGLFDGAADDGCEEVSRGIVSGWRDDALDGLPVGAFASTAHIARLLDAPVLLVVDASALSASVAALVHGYASLDPGVHVAGVVLNRVGSAGHEMLLREALAPLGYPVVGVLRRDERFAWRDRHLGLVPVVEHPHEIAASLDVLAAAVVEGCDLRAIEAIAKGAPRLRTPTIVPSPPRRGSGGSRVTIAVAAGPAFSFLYPDNIELLEAAGAVCVPFDPLVDVALPEGTCGLYAGGGFPEVHAPGLAANRPMLVGVRRAVQAGVVTWAECGGLLWLARALDGHRMAGVIPAEAAMTDRLTLGYRRAVVRTPSPLGDVGRRLRGHEFHYSTVTPAGDALDLTSRFGHGLGGFASPTLFASYLHLHLGGDPDLATAFVEAASRAGSVAAREGTTP